jgi:hypothetical protein
MFPRLTVQLTKLQDRKTKMPKLKRPWTAEDDVRLRYLLEGGDSFMLVAAKLERTTSAVKTRSNKLGLGRQQTVPRVEFAYRI